MRLDARYELVSEQKYERVVERLETVKCQSTKKV